MTAARKFSAFTALLLFLISCNRQQPTSIDNWSEIDTVQDLWTAAPQRMHYLFSMLDLTIEALAPVQTSLSKGDTLLAAKQLLAYFRQTNRKWIETTLELPDEAIALPLADALLHDSIIIRGPAIKIPRDKHDGWQWDFTGPEKDDEFGYSLNGHKYLPALFVATEKTSNDQYIAKFDRIIKDWILHHPLPAPGDSIYLVLDTSQSLDYRDIGEVEWRTLEAGQRLGAGWPQLFYAFQTADAFTPAARLLMLSSLAEQANYLRNYHKSGHNWTTMEMNGLALAALSFPEFKTSEDWAAYALEVMKRELQRQVYPDGVQTEISTKTQWVALRRFESVAENFSKAGRELSSAYLQRLEEMYNYLAYAMRPDGHQPLNNDSDREDIRPWVLQAASKLNRPDWEWIATNGKSGDMPAEGPTVTFPWAGIHVMRNNWHKEAHWAFFDTGPDGTGHQHRDKLHLSIAAFGKDLLVDGGRYTHQNYFSFDPTIWRGYFRSSFSHNLILVDGHGQKAGPTRANSPLEVGKNYVHTTIYDYAHGTFEHGYEDVPGTAIHARSLLYLHDRYWIVLDQFKTDRPRNIQVLWHYAPDCQVVLRGNEATSNNPQGANLRILPLGPTDWHAAILEGQEKPVIQGWYSADYGIKVPNPTVVYSANIEESSNFAWLLAPAAGIVPVFDADFQVLNEAVSLSIVQKGAAPTVITLPLDGQAGKVIVKRGK